MRSQNVCHFTNINTIVSKDYFSLLNIDELVDFTVGFKIMSFMDAYSGYHQIRMHHKDKEKITFIIEKRDIMLYKDDFWFKECDSYLLKVGKKIFQDQIDCNIEAYIDDMMVSMKLLKTTS